MSISKQDARRTRQSVLVGDRSSTADMDASNTEETLQFSGATNKVSIQTSGDLAVNFTVSINGVDFVAGGSASNSAITTYNTHLVSHIKFVRSGGSGRVLVLAS